MTSFTSEGPARLTNDLKPDISAPGLRDRGRRRRAPGTRRVACRAPRWPHRTSRAWPSCSASSTRAGARPRSRRVLMNQANRNMVDNDLTAPVPATVMGSGRVQGVPVGSGQVGGVAREPVVRVRADTDGLVGHPELPGEELRQQAARYTVTGEDRYSDFDPAMTTVRFSLDGATFGATQVVHAERRPAATGLDAAHGGPEPRSRSPSRSTGGTTSSRAWTAPSRSTQSGKPERHPPACRGTSRRSRHRTTGSRTDTPRPDGRPRRAGADRGHGGGRLLRRPLPARVDRSGREPRRGRHRRGGRPVVHGRHDRRDRRGTPNGESTSSRASRGSTSSPMTTHPTSRSRSACRPGACTTSRRRSRSTS